ncbi:MAG: copper resistance protein CopC [Microbacteriaceae bacterium]
MKLLHKLLTGALVAASVVFAPIAASAHSELESSTPSAGETVEAGQLTIALMFGEALMTTGANANVISVQGPAGPDNAQWADGCIDSVRGNLMSESVSLSAPGDYVVNWRAVSADGHPIEGSYEFTLKNSTGFESNTPGLCADSALTENGTQLLPVTKDQAKAQTLFAITPEEGLIGGLVVIAFISVIGAFMLRAQERKREAAELAAKLAREKAKN